MSLGRSFNPCITSHFLPFLIRMKRSWNTYCPLLHACLTKTIMFWPCCFKRPLGTSCNSALLALGATFLFFVACGSMQRDSRTNDSRAAQNLIKPKQVETLNCGAKSIIEIAFALVGSGSSLWRQQGTNERYRWLCWKTGDGRGNNDLLVKRDTS